jgi:hypothetical protein
MRRALSLAISSLMLACGQKPGSGELLGTFQQPVNLIAADDTAIYGVGVNLERIPLSGGPPVVMAPGIEGDSLTLAGDSVLWYQEIDKTILSMPKTSGTPRIVASSQYDAGSFQSDGTNLYWVTFDYLTNPEAWSIRSMPIAGGPVTNLLSLTTAAIHALAVDESRIYFLTEDQGGLAVPTTGPFGIQAIPKDGSTAPVMLHASDGFSIHGLFRVGTGLLWPEGALFMQTVRRMELGTGEITTFAQMAAGEEATFAIDTAGAFAFIPQCGNRTTGCWTWVRTLPDRKDLAYVDGFASAATLDARWIYWVVGKGDLRRIPR